MFPDSPSNPPTVQCHYRTPIVAAVHQTTWSDVEQDLYQLTVQLPASVNTALDPTYVERRVAELLNEAAARLDAYLRVLRVNTELFGLDSPSLEFSKATSMTAHPRSHQGVRYLQLLGKLDEVEVLGAHLYLSGVIDKETREIQEAKSQSLFEGVAFELALLREQAQTIEV